MPSALVKKLPKRVMITPVAAPKPAALALLGLGGLLLCVWQLSNLS
jgi:hypothetical protein